MDVKIRISNNQNGFSIIEVIVVVGLLSILSLAAVSLMEMMVKNESSSRYRTNSDVLMNEVRALLSSRQACINSLNNPFPFAITLAPATNYPIPDLRDSTAAPGAIA